MRLIGDELAGCANLTWIVAVFGIVLVVVVLVVVRILLRIWAELLAHSALHRSQLPILLRIHRVVVGTAFGRFRRLGPVVPQPESACEVPLSPSGQWPSVISLVESDFPSAAETSV